MVALLCRCRRGDDRTAKGVPGKFEDRWSEGPWLGCDVRSGEHLIGMDSGVFRVSTVRSKIADTRRSPDKVASMSGTPRTASTWAELQPLARLHEEMRASSTSSCRVCSTYSRPSDDSVMEKIQERHRQAWGHTRMPRLPSHHQWQTTPIAQSWMSIQNRGDDC